HAAVQRRKTVDRRYQSQSRHLGGRRLPARARRRWHSVSPVPERAYHGCPGTSPGTMKIRHVEARDRERIHQILVATNRFTEEEARKAAGGCLSRRRRRKATGRRCGFTSAAATTRSRASKTFTGSRTTRSSSARSCPKPKYEPQPFSLPCPRALRMRHSDRAGVAVRA